MSRKLVYIACILTFGITGCSDKPYSVKDLPSSPDGALQARSYALDDTVNIKISSDGKWDKFYPLVIGQCSGVSFFWKGPREAVVEYDKVQVAHFISSPRYYGGATVSICDRQSKSCGSAVSGKHVLAGCDEATM